MPSSDRLVDFVRALTRLADAGADEAAYLREGRALLTTLVEKDDWLPAAFAVPGPTYRQYLLYADPASRFSVVSFVWAPGQHTPIHDHRVWGLIGQLRGEERATIVVPAALGQPVRQGETHVLLPGQVGDVSPSGDDVHIVANALTDQVSISIHVYGGDIGRFHRHVFDPSTSQPRDFVSGYHNEAPALARLLA